MSKLLRLLNIIQKHCSILFLWTDSSGVASGKLAMSCDVLSKIADRLWFNKTPEKDV